MAWDISIDVYRTWVPLKVPPHTIALAALVLAAKFADLQFEVDLDEFAVDKAHLQLALEELLELYLHQRAHTIACAMPNEDRLLAIRNTLNRRRVGPEEMSKQENGTHIESSPKSCVPLTLEARSTQTGDRGTMRFLLDKERVKNETELMEMER